MRGIGGWTGAINVTQYMFYAGVKQEEMSKVSMIARQDFEAEFVRRTSASYIQVGAIQCLKRRR